MKLQSDILMAELDARLKAIKSQAKDVISYHVQAIYATDAVMKKLKKQLAEHRFENEAEEIEFFKHIKPKFTAKLWYNARIYSIELNKPIDSERAILLHFRKELKKLQAFFNKNKEFYNYYRSGATSLDSCYFVRTKYDVLQSSRASLLDNDVWRTSRDYLVGRIMANDEIKGYLENAIYELQYKKAIEPKTGITMQWTGSKVALVELIYALHAEGVLNNAASQLKEVVSFFESAFNIDLGQFHTSFLAIRARKTERTKFLTSLTDRLLVRMDEADETQY